MRAKKWQLIITFAATTAAMAFERAAKTQDLPGRLIPVPTVIQAGCGLAFCLEPAERTAAQALLDEQGLAAEGIHEIWL